jgi:2'-5' RNA ligase
MDRHLGSGRTLNHFALVSYIPEPLASYLDNLRRQLTPECNPHAHLTILPPRPFRGHVESAVDGLVAAAADLAPFQVTLGQIDVFPVSNVIFLGIESGQELVKTLNERFSEGVLEHECTYPFHPHVTIAQDFEEQDVDAHLAKARQIWEAWKGSRTFTVDRLSFVHHAVLDHWADLATVSLGAGQTVA